MKITRTHVFSLALPVLVSASFLHANATASKPSEITRTKLLTAHFDSRTLAQIEAGSFHFLPGQTAPLHTHQAPAVGYVAKGSILYQVEGEQPVLLKAGDAFYEPAGPKILRFDNASATDKAVFIDFNFQQKEEPFIVFNAPLTEAIDRRAMPTMTLNGQTIDDVTIDEVNVFRTELTPNHQQQLNSAMPLLGYVAQGSVKLRRPGKKIERYNAGESYAIPANQKVTLYSASTELSAEVISFEMSQ